MPLLFSYGTLQQNDVQMSTFGRLLHGTRDELPRYGKSFVAIEDPRLVAEYGRTHNANVVFNGKSESVVSGTLFEITDAELAAADGYESPDGYRRITVVLRSGKEAWVYVHSPTAQQHP